MNTEVGHCSVCGVLANIYPDPPAPAFCEEHCPEHDYQYDKWRRGRFCIICDKQRNSWEDD